MVSLAIWMVFAICAAGFFFYATRLIKRQTETDTFDTGVAIIEFGRAYPDEAIRQVAMANNGEMVFLRLWTGRCGCMRRAGARFICHLIDPATVRVTSTDDGEGLIVDFPGIKALTGEFRFRSPKEAAEVSLWILGSFTAGNLSQHATSPA